MKRVVLISTIFFVLVSCYGQVIEDEFTVISIDSIDYYYMIYVHDSSNSKKLILSQKEPGDTIDCKCRLKMIKPGDRFHLKLHEQLYICANREKNLYIDLLTMDFYEKDKLIANKYKVPYYTSSFFELTYCPCLEMREE